MTRRERLEREERELLEMWEKLSFQRGFDPEACEGIVFRTRERLNQVREDLECLEG